ncbi:Major Facilitator Superfamily protein [Azotobacter beijerinckii]|uniref:Major Facilitator Superfamily protein n=1 Tax=Azotobacter beijerinckii TaxID=170623 RepID=A0A1I4EJE1_9GAMM|nr:Major Facilitator Superfamily protein [Azotobacter beijerinckii]SFL04251.1 Major Facilitator Superfamily protein [Azotobacter beijerinckii]
MVVGERLSFMSVLGRVGPYGLAMALGTLGYGTIAAFITLYYDSRGWAWAEYAMTAFGFSFIAARLLFAQAIDRLGGYRVGIACLLVEGGGLLLLWAAPGPLLAMLGAGLSGFGFSLVFPALGVEAVKSTPASNRGAAIGAYSLFLDLALGVAGPLIGLLIGSQGFRSIFLVCALAAFCGLGLTLVLQQRSARQPAGSAAELAAVEAD